MEALDRLLQDTEEEIVREAEEAARSERGYDGGAEEEAFEGKGKKRASPTASEQWDAAGLVGPEGSRVGYWQGEEMNFFD